MSSGVQRKYYGSFVGTGAAIDVKVAGFRPKHVALFNVTGLVKADWSETMADGSAVKQITDGTISFVTSNGITPLSNGFRVGTDADINVSGEVVHYVATE